MKLKQFKQINFEMYFLTRRRADTVRSASARIQIQKNLHEGKNEMMISRATLQMTAAALIVCTFFSAGAHAQDKPSGAELPKASEIPDVSPDVLIRADVPNAPNEVLIVSRTTYKPGAHVAKHYHTSQIVFYILQGTMSVKDDGKDPFRLKAGDHLLIKPGTVHEHWNESKTEPLVFVEYVLVDKGQRSAVFVK